MGLGYSLQSNRKMLEGASHPDRGAQFEHINATVAAAQALGQPTISVDTKKKELVGDFKNAGRDWRPKGEPVLVRTKDLVIAWDGDAASQRLRQRLEAERNAEPEPTDEGAL